MRLVELSERRHVCYEEQWSEHWPLGNSRCALRRGRWMIAATQLSQGRSFDAAREALNRWPVGDRALPRHPIHADTRITTRASILCHNHNGHIRHRPPKLFDLHFAHSTSFLFFFCFFRGFACMRYINPRLIDWLIDWRRRGWPTRQDVGWQCRSHSGVVWGQQRCAFRKIPSALVHRVWPKIHDHSP